MDKQVKLVFRYRGLRSFIDLDLCSQCPRADLKGCCGHYSPVFYLLDLAYLARTNPELIDMIFSLPDLTVLDASVTINKIPDSEGFICPMLDKNSGCRLEQMQRESVCRHFICIGVPWFEEEALAKWVRFFDELGVLEIGINNKWAEIIDLLGLSLRNPRDRRLIIETSVNLLNDLLDDPPDLVSSPWYDEEYAMMIQYNEIKEWHL